MKPLRVLVAPDSFKESLGALEAAEALARGLRQAGVGIETNCVPLADGGEGTVSSLLLFFGGQAQSVSVRGPLGDPVTASYALLNNDTAVMEMAAASGLGLVPRGQRNPRNTTTYGTGELLLHIVRTGVRRTLIGVGGSATVDGGVGALQAVGVRFFDDDGQELPAEPDIVGRVASMDATAVLPELLAAELIVACDVDNPLVGEQGAAPVFGPQKGADLRLVAILSAALDRLGALYEKHSGVPVRNVAGAGAAGGLAAGLRAVLGARLDPGIDVVLDAIRFESLLERSDLVITGEGSFDGQTSRGKVAAGVGRRAQQAGKPVIVVCGRVAPEADDTLPPGICAVVPVQSGPMTLDASMQQAAHLLVQTGRRIGRLLEIGFLLLEQ